MSSKEQPIFDNKDIKLTVNNLHEMNDEQKEFYLAQKYPENGENMETYSDDIARR
ncbi:MAG: hypothetical protein WCG91_01310 [Candidatus Shapirobacteria bacterium]